MLKLNVADYMINNLAGLNFDNRIMLSQTIDILIENWSNQKYPELATEKEYLISNKQIIFESKSLNKIMHC